MHFRKYNLIKTNTNSYRQHLEAFTEQIYSFIFVLNVNLIKMGILVFHMNESKRLIAIEDHDKQ